MNGALGNQRSVVHLVNAVVEQPVLGINRARRDCGLDWRPKAQQGPLTVLSSVDGP